jgi:hypothetical protein
VNAGILAELAFVVLHHCSLVSSKIVGIFVGIRASPELRYQQCPSRTSASGRPRPALAPANSRMAAGSTF